MGNLKTYPYEKSIEPTELKPIVFALFSQTKEKAPTKYL